MGKKLARPKKKKELAVAIIVDPMGWSGATADEEVAQHQKRFSLILSDYDLRFSAPKCVMPDMAADLVIYDFGGMGPGTCLMEDNSRGVIKWAADHPSALVVVVSTFTFNAYIKPEMEALGLKDIRNVVMDDYKVDSPIPSWFGK